VKLSPASASAVASVPTTDPAAAVSDTWLFERLMSSGGSFTGATVMLTVATLLSALPSFALNAKLSGPL
jgi:hypothetical protein